LSGAASGFRPVLLAWALLSALTGGPYLRAWLAPPPGTAFLGFFYFVDDSYNYLSYVEQAERGAFLFHNKLVLEPRPPALVNLEWWLVGRVSRVLGGRPFLAFRLLGLAAGLALLAGIDRWLRAAGLGERHRLPALLLVATGGGLGGLSWRAGLLPLPQAVDLTTGLFPFVELLANPHFAAGTALLLWALWAFFRAAGWRQQAAAGLLGTALGLVRPYDLVLLAATRGLAVFASEPWREWPRRLAPLVSLLPVALYDGWVFFGLPDFGSFALRYVLPSPASLVLALGPAAALALLAFRRPAGVWPGKAARLHLAAWATLAAAILLVRPVGFALQFLVGVGVPLLGLGALGLCRFPPRATVLAALAFSSTALVALGLVLADNPRWYVPPEPLQAVAALGATCQAGELAFTPPDMGLYLGGLTACTPYLSHAAAPGHEARWETVRWFYDGASAAERAALLDRLCVAQVALPGGPEPFPAAWLGPASPFRWTATAGAGPRRISLYTRTDRSGCPASSPPAP
jgi:hypothetical protein